MIWMKFHVDLRAALIIIVIVMSKIRTCIRCLLNVDNTKNKLLLQRPPSLKLIRKLKLSS